MYHQSQRDEEDCPPQYAYHDPDQRWGWYPMLNSSAQNSTITVHSETQSFGNVSNRRECTKCSERQVGKSCLGCGRKIRRMPSAVVDCNGNYEQLRSLSSGKLGRRQKSGDPEWAPGSAALEPSFRGRTRAKDRKHSDRDTLNTSVQKGQKRVLRSKSHSDNGYPALTIQPEVATQELDYTDCWNRRSITSEMLACVASASQDDGQGQNRGGVMGTGACDQERIDKETTPVDFDTHSNRASKETRSPKTANTGSENIGTNETGDLTDCPDENPEHKANTYIDDKGLSLANTGQFKELSLSNASQFKELSLSNASQFKALSLSNTSQFKELSLSNASQFKELSLSNTSQFKELSLSEYRQLVIEEDSVVNPFDGASEHRSNRRFLTGHNSTKIQPASQEMIEIVHKTDPKVHENSPKMTISELAGERMPPTLHRPLQQNTQVANSCNNVPEACVKIVLLGDYGVGKSHLMRALYDAASSGKAGFRCAAYRAREFLELTTVRADQRVRVKIVDTAGLERFRSLTSSYFRGAQGCFLVFNITRKDSFDSIMEW